MESGIEELRPKAFAIAYRMLGTVSDAEDVAQETMLRLHQAHADDRDIASPGAYVATIATRLSIDHLRSARVQREEYLGEWLPAPVLTDDADPARDAELAESLSLAFLIVLERLSPEQRAVFLLREVFEYPYARIGEIIGKSEGAVRQMAVRARRHVEAGRPRFDAPAHQHEELAGRFFAAVQDGDMDALEALLAEDVVLLGDGGGKVPAIPRPVHGRARVANAVSAWARVGLRGGAVITQTRVNGQPGGVLTDAQGRVLGVLALQVVGGSITALHSVVNPDKLEHLGPVGDLRALLRGGG